MQKERKKKISKFKLIPKVGSPIREKLLEILTGLDDYKKAIERGLRLFTEEQLLQIEDQYKGGMTWEEIDTVMSNQGTLLKQATFRKYMQDEIIPKAKDYKSRVAIYDKQIIRHLNFVNFYYKVTDTPMIDFLSGLLVDMKISYYDAVVSKLGNESSGNLYVDLIKEIAGFPECYVSDAINKAIANPEDKEKALKMLRKIENDFNAKIAKDIKELCTFLKSREMLITQLPDENQHVVVIL